MSDTGSLRRTALVERHRGLGARLIEFGGWEMPVQYTGIIDEHRADFGRGDFLIRGNGGCLRHWPRVLAVTPRERLRRDRLI